MADETFRYYVSFVAGGKDRLTFASAIVQRSTPIETAEDIENLRSKIQSDKNETGLVLLNWKRIQ